MRKLLVGLISLGAVLAAYLLYTGASDSPVLDTDSGSEFIEAAADSNIADFDTNVGKIGGIGLGRTEVAKYITLNKETKEVERELGFEKLLHEERGFWELEKPYVNVFQPDFTCYITADRGLVQVETAVSACISIQPIRIQLGSLPKPEEKLAPPKFSTLEPPPWIEPSSKAV